MQRPSRSRDGLVSCQGIANAGNPNGEFVQTLPYNELGLVHFFVPYEA
jgi:hypothetical protein